MDTFTPGTVEYDDAHGLYVRGADLLREAATRVVSPGQDPPGRGWERVATLAHPGVARHMAETPAGRDALLNSVAFKHYGLVGQGQGCDIAEFQSSTPSGFQFYVERLLNENGREDSRARMHKRNIDGWGAPVGAYGIVRPGPDAVAWAQHFVALLRELGPWTFVPTVDVELGNPAANRPYVAEVTRVLRESGYPVVMGYFSAGSGYRFQTQDLVDLWWLAAWGARLPAEAAIHQWQGSPLDRDYCPDFARISTGPAPKPTPPPPPKPRRKPDMYLLQTPEEHRYQVNPGARFPVSKLQNGKVYVDLAGQGVPHSENVDGLVVVQIALDMGMTVDEINATLAYDD